MVSLTLSVPKDMKEKMDSFIDINWSAVAREAIRRRMRELEFLKEFTKESEFTEEDALRLGAEMSKQLTKRYKK